MKNFVITLFVLASLIFTMTGCDKAEKTVRDLREKSAELSVYGGKLTKAFGDAYRAGEITQSQLAQLNVGTGAFTTSLGVYRDAVAEAERIVRSGEPLPTTTIATLERILDDRVIAAFFDILAKVGILPLAQSEPIKLIISSIRLTILALRGAFSDARDLMKQAEVNTAFLNEVQTQGGTRWIG